MKKGCYPVDGSPFFVNWSRVPTYFCRMKKLVSAQLPCEHGNFVMIAFGSDVKKMPHLALVHKELLDEQGSMRIHSNMPVRIHSECMTGDVFGSKRCECGEQLQMALRILGSNETPGILLYLRQEGRGIGLVEKLKAYNLQDEGLDTFEANRALGHADDNRNYGTAVDILRHLGVTNIELMTNNPEKLKAMKDAGIAAERVSLEIPPNDVNAGYLASKRDAGHLLAQ